MIIEDDKCFECKAPVEHWHHVVPRSLGGTAMIPLCISCHGKAHGIKWNTDHKNLIKLGIERSKENGTKWGRPMTVPDEKVKELKEAGLSYRQISKELKIAQGSITASLRRTGVI